MAIKKEDVRITKTKAALAEAFFGMLTTMPLEDITVNDLCQKADVRRATFYKHFSDKSDFVFFLINDTCKRFDAKAKDVGTTRKEVKEYYLDCAESVVDYLLKYEDAMEHTLKSGIRPMFIEMFVKQNHEDTVAHLKESQAEGLALFTSPDMVAAMLIGGAARAIMQWAVTKGDA
jgi:AcrR family transcriptional regulator